MEELPFERDQRRPSLPIDRTSDDDEFVPITSLAPLDEAIRYLHQPPADAFGQEDAVQHPAQPARIKRRALRQAVLAAQPLPIGADLGKSVEDRQGRLVAACAEPVKKAQRHLCHHLPHPGPCGGPARRAMKGKYPGPAGFGRKSNQMVNTARGG